MSYEITPTPLSKQIEFTRESVRVSKFHLDHANTPGLKNYWTRIHEGHKQKLERLINQNGGS